MPLRCWTLCAGRAPCWWRRTASAAGSVGERLACALEQAGISARVALCSSGDTFTPHGSVGELKRLLELDGAGLAQRAMEVLRFDKTAAGCLN